ncbi:MAG TPA: arylesterase [Longimicrobiales bacterium]|nr:arylesterase [Longimicrobiales bacterium]
MRRIILGLCAVALTSCDAGGGGPRADVPAGDVDMEETGAAAGVADESRGAPVAPVPPHMEETQNIVVVGTSLTAGYGIAAELAYPAVLQATIDSAGLPFEVVNAGISGETSAGGLRRIDWSLQQPVDVLILELGANDGLRALDPDAMRSNLDAILTRTKDRYPDADLLILGMEAPPNLGQVYTTRFRQVFREMARKHDAALVPFLLEGVAGNPALNLDDGIHPSPEGHRIIARTVWAELGPILESRTGAAAVR